MLRLSAAAVLCLFNLHPAWASDPDIKALCLEASNMGEDLCACVAGKAADMTPDQQAFIAAMLAEDEAETARLRGSMPATDMMQVGMFMPNAAADCAREGTSAGN